MSEMIFVKSENMKQPVLRLGIDYELSRLNDTRYYKSIGYVCDGVFVECSISMAHPFKGCSCEIVDVSNDVIEKYSFKSHRFDLSKINDIAVNILKVLPRLSSGTCMGWADYEDKSKNPNWFDGTYIFPDGNKYSIVLCCGNVSVFPGEVNFSASYHDSNKLPISTFKIDKVKWGYDNEIVVVD